MTRFLSPPLGSELFSVCPKFIRAWVKPLHRLWFRMCIIAEVGVKIKSVKLFSNFNVDQFTAEHELFEFIAKVFQQDATEKNHKIFWRAIFSIRHVRIIQWVNKWGGGDNQKKSSFAFSQISESMFQLFV